MSYEINDIKAIKLGDIQIDLYSDVAEKIARTLSDGDKKDTTSQIRRFYDELVMWHDKVYVSENQGDKFKECAPYIQMIRAKVAYAKGRGHVSNEFYKVMDTLLRQIQNPKTLRQAKLFFEAVIGFRKALEKK